MKVGLLSKSIIACAAPLLFLAASHLVGQGNGTAVQKARDRSVPLDGEARNAARLYWDSEYTKCGTSFYRYEVPNEVASDPSVYLDAQGILRWRKAPAMSQDTTNGVFRLGDTRWVIFEEYRGLSFDTLRVASTPLSQGDRLNGVEWHGDVVAQQKEVSRRTRNTEGNDYAMHWLPWGEFDTVKSEFRVFPTKKNGQWSVNGKETEKLGRKIESCSAESKFLPFK